MRQTPGAPPVEAYEMLRRAAVSPSSRGESLQGFGAFVRRGMAAWMRIWRPAVSPAMPTGPQADPRLGSTCLPPEVRRDVVGILVAMVLSRAKEACP